MKMTMIKMNQKFRRYNAGCEKLDMVPIMQNPLYYTLKNIVPPRVAAATWWIADIKVTTDV